jgi:electron transfer flavoprotein alpha subunit
MAAQVFAYIEHKNGVADDTALELISAAQNITPDVAPFAIVTGSGADLDAVCNDLSASYAEVWKFDSEALAYPNAEVIRQLLVAVLPAEAVVLIPHDTFGMDLAPGLSIKLESVFISDAVGFEGMEGEYLKVIRQEYSGQVSTHVKGDISAGAVINIRPGVFQPDESKSAAGQVIDKSSEIGELTTNRRFLEIVEAEAGDVDITKEDILVSVGRGIEDQDNIEIAEELADAVGGVVSCSRPVVDAKWLEKARQVGTSGQTVKPKVYMALGISGSFQHLGGLKGNPFIVRTPRRPFFRSRMSGLSKIFLISCRY